MTYQIPTTEEVKAATLRFINAPMCTWAEIPPGDGARLIPSLTTVVKLTTKEWEQPKYHDGCFPSITGMAALKNAQLLGVVIKTDETRRDVLPGGLLMIAGNTEVEHVVWHGERRPLR